jgi:hypothetical protein
MADKAIQRALFCAKCRVKKDESEYGKSTTNPEKKATVCKACARSRQSIWEQENKTRNLNIAYPNGEFTCRTCFKTKPSIEFMRAAKTRSGFETECRECIRARDRRRYQRDKKKRLEQSKFGQIKWKYGLSKSDWEAMIQSAGGKCEICNSEFVFDKPRSHNRPCVDHNHETGVVRGILCARCNQGLGLFCESVDSIKSAAKYLMER